jgi:hypothetical protein
MDHPKGKDEYGESQSKGIDKEWGYKYCPSSGNLE